MSLVFDKRAALGAAPGVHAFIVGVSDYPSLPVDPAPLMPHHFSMRPLSSPALGAFAFYNWLIHPTTELPLPLATCRLLLAPSALELANDPTVGASGAAPPSVNNFLQDAADWRNDASTSADNITIFYFAGHGVQRGKDDAVLLLREFGNGLGAPLVNAVDVKNVFFGMAPGATRPQIANTQLYFVDACRNFPSAFTAFETLQTTQVFAVELSGQDNRRAPIFYASIGGATALGLRGKQTLFSRAVVECLKNDAADLQDIDGVERWGVTIHRLGKNLDTKIGDLNEELGGDQDWGFGGIPKDASICFLSQAPTVDVHLEIDPVGALNAATVEVRDETGAPVAVPNPLNPNPYGCRWPAGMYSIGATIAAGDPNGFKSIVPKARPVLPPKYRRTMRVL